MEHAEDGLDVLRESGDPETLIVAFGPFGEAPIEGHEPEEIRRLSELNYVLPAALIAAVLPGMRARGYGRILVFGNTFGDRLVGFKRVASYAAAKTALASFVKSTARQTADIDVRCNMICPGYVVTEYHSEATGRRYAERMPGGTAQSAESIARLARWLVSEENQAVSGAIVAADRGL
jgi:NAD(P)-dependent dehydrogenase (short-subunit alcohol dehydrogenase family)